MAVFDNFKYIVLENGTVEITEYTGKETAVTIPSEIDGKTVTSIGDEAFYGNGKLTGVAIPSGVRAIGAAVFCDCKNLAEIKIPRSVNSIGAKAFAFTKWLKSYPNDYVVINGILCEYKGIARDVVIPDGVKVIADSTFGGHSKLTSTTIPDGVKSIGSEAFFACAKLRSVTIPASVKSIGEDAFGECDNLAGLTVPKSREKLVREQLSDEQLEKLTITITENVPAATEGNAEKYDIYRMMKGNLSKAMNAEFYYQAIFIEYAIIEDRCLSVLKHAGVKCVDNREQELKLSAKINKLRDNSAFHVPYIRKRLTLEFLKELEEWKRERDKLIHALAKTPYNSENIRSIAATGYELVKQLDNKVSSVNRYLDKMNNNNTI